MDTCECENESRCGFCGYPKSTCTFTNCVYCKKIRCDNSFYTCNMCDNEFCYRHNYIELAIVGYECIMCIECYESLDIISGKQKPEPPESWEIDHSCGKYEDEDEDNHYHNHKQE